MARSWVRQLQVRVGAGHNLERGIPCWTIALIFALAPGQRSWGGRASSAEFKARGGAHPARSALTCGLAVHEIAYI